MIFARKNAIFRLGIRIASARLRDFSARVQLTSNLNSAAFCPKTAFFVPKTVNFGGWRGQLETYRNLKLKCKSEVFQKSKKKFKNEEDLL